MGTSAAPTPRDLWLAIEPIHAVVYFAPVPEPDRAALAELTGRQR